jgi:hypothetical protein
MGGATLPANVKWTSALRRLPSFHRLRYVKAAGLEGCVCAFKLASESSPIVVEAVSGRPMRLVPGDVFLGTPGYRESTRWVVGGIPKRGLVPGKTYWVIAECGMVGDLIAGTPLAKTFLGQAKYLGAVSGDDGRTLTLKQFAVRATDRAADHRAPVYLIVGTSAEVGKTTAGLAVLRALLEYGDQTVIVLKATGTSAITEIAAYQDYGAAQVFDCVDFGLPSTYPSNRKGMDRIFDRALDICLSIPADAVLIECGGDLLGANVPVVLKVLKRKRSRPRVILTAADAFGAWGGMRMLRDMGLSVDLITGPCTDTPALRRRTQTLCRTPAVNMIRTETEDALS